MTVLVANIFSSLKSNVDKNEELERDKRDPANWWKYGGDPFQQDSGYSDTIEDEDA